VSATKRRSAPGRLGSGSQDDVGLESVVGGSERRNVGAEAVAKSLRNQLGRTILIALTAVLADVFHIHDLQSFHRVMVLLSSQWLWLD
jgi:hypothetical protein